MDDYVGLERFWQRYNKVRLEQLSLERTKAALAEDNQKLRQLLKQYLDGISVNDEVLSQINPLVIINQRNIVPALSRTVPVTETRVQRPIYNIVEAALEVKRLLWATLSQAAHVLQSLSERSPPQVAIKESNMVSEAS